LFRRLFLLAYTCSGLAGLVYEVSWTRLLTLYIGHTTAAASAVVAAFMGGLALGAAAGGRIVSRLTPRQCLFVYCGLEAVVILVALVLPLELAALTPVLRWSYQDGSGGAFFAIVRLAACFGVMLVPAIALGATFPVAVRAYAPDSEGAPRSAGALYAANTAGAAIGALLAGFVLIPALGVSGATYVGVGASLAAIAGVLALTSPRADGTGVEHEPPRRKGSKSRATKSAKAREAAPPPPDPAPAWREAAPPPPDPAPAWLAAVVLGITGFGSLMFEIAWTRVLALTVGPTTYAFSATLAALIVGLALGSALGAVIAARTVRPASWLAFALAVSAVTAAWTCSLAGNDVPRYVAAEVARSPELLRQIHTRGAAFVAALILPTAIGLGAAFPLALATISDSLASLTRRLGLVYAVNTLGAVGGSLMAGFVTISAIGLQNTIQLVAALLIGAALIVVAWGRLTPTAQAVNGTALAAAAVILVVSPVWDRALLASGIYLYAPYVPKDLELEPLLKAGTLEYYREGAAGTVSVKRLTGTLSLAIDGKVDASNRSDMLTQKLVAHLPLLLHENPKDVAIIGLGSGVTLSAALRHPIARADVVEISPEVVEASHLFEKENRRALEDARTRLIVGDGRSHLLLSQRKYDVIISEPSNPWIAGVAALFTQEFFRAVRDRLTPGGIVCQWAHTYHISDRDLRSIAATFTSVFPDGTLWLVGESDVLLLASNSPLESRLASLSRGWTRPEVAADLSESLVMDPFAIWSLYAGGPEELASYGARAPILTDDRMSLEFSGPGELQEDTAAANATALAGLLDEGGGPPAVRGALDRADAAAWRRRGAMMFAADAHGAAYDDYDRALGLDPGNADALDGFVKAALPAGRALQALTRVNAIIEDRPRSAALLVTQSKLLAATRSTVDALEAAREASLLEPVQPMALEQLASLLADAGNRSELEATVRRMEETAPDRPGTWYYAGVLRYLRGEFEETVRLCDRAVTLDSAYAPVYDLLGAARTKLNRPEAAREAFEQSLRLNAHDASAYANLGLLALTAGNRAVAANYFAEALWLDPASRTARDGLAAARASK
jgi:spermidine synthase